MRKGKRISRFNILKSLEINQGVKIEVSSGKYEGRHSSQIVDLVDEDTFVINTPFKEGRIVNLAIGTKIKVLVGQDNGLYSLPVKIMQRKVDGTPLLVVTIIGEIKKVQQREFFRLEIYQSTEYRIVDDQEDIVWDDEVESHKGIIEDISAGGLKILTRNNRIFVGETIQVRIDFADLSFDTVLTRVERVVDMTKKNEKRYSLGVQFLDLGKEHKDEIMRWLFQKQRELRKKGLI